MFICKYNQWIFIVKVLFLCAVINNKGFVHGQGLAHVGDIFRILNHVDIPPVDTSFLPQPLADVLAVQQPPPPNVLDVQLYLVTSVDPLTRHQVVSVADMQQHWTTNANDEESKSNESQGLMGEIKFIIHGWGETAHKPYFGEMTNEYMKKWSEDEIGNGTKQVHAVVQVDWGTEAAVEYSQAAHNTKRVGHFVGKFITSLHRTMKIPLEKVHVIGHSLGGHVAGFTGKEVIKQTGKQVGRITGLDPAGPLFEGILITPSNRLSETDAVVVDIVHTDGGFFGYRAPLGTVDFYPNGGVRTQPGCGAIKPESISVDNVMDFTFCSHTRSYHFFIESINDRDGHLMASKCDSWPNYEHGQCTNEEVIQFGERLPATVTSGSYYFKTNSEPPYGIANIV